MESEHGDKVHEIVVGNITIDIYKRENKTTGAVYFDYLNRRSFYANNEYHKSPFCQQRDLRDHLRALIDTMEWISGEYRNFRLSSEQKED